MRRGFVLAVLGLGALALFVAMLLSPGGRRTSPAFAGPTVTVDSLPSLETPAPGESNFVKRAKLPSPRSAATSGATVVVSTIEERAVNPSAEQQEQSEARVAARIVELGELGRRTDRAALETLLLEVRNPHADIRQAALDALSQSGNRAALPRLSEIAAQTEDARAKEAIEEVIEFINLPTLTEVLRGHSATNSPRPAPVRP